MSTESTSTDQGVASFTYCPADKDTPLLFEFQRPLDDLEEMLQDEYAGDTVSAYDIYRKHSVDRPYLKRHYKAILMNMEQSGKVCVFDPQKKDARKTLWRTDC